MLFVGEVHILASRSITLPYFYPLASAAREAEPHFFAALEGRRAVLGRLDPATQGAPRVREGVGPACNTEVRYGEER